MGKHPNNIENEITYFYAVVKNMDLKDSITQSKIRKHEVSFEENIYSQQYGQAIVRYLFI